MLKFFRTIRKKLIEKDNVRRYLLYAIGEILLVVIGILIALQVNNWNEERKRQQDIRSYVTAMVSDLEQDVREIDIRIEQIEEKIASIDRLADYIRDKPLQEIQNEDLLVFIPQFYIYRPFSWYQTSIEELVNSSSLKDIQNDELREKVVSYYALAEHLIEDYTSDYAYSERLQILQDNILNFNYPDRQEMRQEL